MPVGPSLLAAGMAGSDKCARASVAHHASDYSAACSTPSPISRPLAVFFVAASASVAGPAGSVAGPAESVAGFASLPVASPDLQVVFGLSLVSPHMPAQTT